MTPTHSQKRGAQGLALLTMALASCTIDVPPPDQYSDPDAITDVAAARALLTSCYQLFPHYEYELSTLGDDYCPTNVSNRDVEQQNLYLWQERSINDLAASVWIAYYNCIAVTDVLLHRMASVRAPTPAEAEERAAIEAEGKTLKALCYFDLLRLFASPYGAAGDDAGVVVKVATGVETLPRSSKREVVEMIRNLLGDAVEAGSQPERNGWLSARAARLLMADVSLYAGDMASARENSLAVVAQCDAAFISGTNYSRLWSADSWAGRIFAFHTSSAFMAGIQYSATEGDYFALNPAFTFAEGDARAEWAVAEREMAGSARRLVGKYNKVNKEGGTNAYICRLRWAHAYFIAAEAQARQGDTGGALATLNAYLTAVGAEPLTATGSADEMAAAIVAEKRKEFAGEGQNYFDIKRTGAPLERLGTWGGTRSTIRPDDFRRTFPIPASEYRYNEMVRQNEGWRAINN